MDQPPRAYVLLLGMLGALAPEIARLYGSRRTLLKESFSYRYWIVSAVYAFTGGIIAVILPAVTLWAAFYTGVTWPLLFTKAIQQTHFGVKSLGNDAGPAASFKKPLAEVIRSHADSL